MQNYRARDSSRKANLDWVGLKHRLATGLSNRALEFIILQICRILAGSFFSVHGLTETKGHFG